MGRSWRFRRWRTPRSWIPLHGRGARYLYLYAPIVVLFNAWAVRHPVAIGLIFAVMLFFSARSLTTMPLGVNGVASNLPIPEHMGSLIRTLRAENIDAVTADYWIAYRLTFESREQIIATGIPSHRHKPFQDFVRNRSRSAWVYVDNSIADQRFTASLRDQGIPFRTPQDRRFRHPHPGPAGPPAGGRLPVSAGGAMIWPTVGGPPGLAGVPEKGDQ